jgi:hypothetical protein
MLFECAVAFGLETSLRLAARFGGQSLYLPVKAEADHAIARELGVPVLAWLIQHHEHRLTGETRRIVVPLPAGGGMLWK